MLRAQPFPENAADQSARPENEHPRHGGSLAGGFSGRFEGEVSWSSRAGIGDRWGGVVASVR
jgi:hypothetical protein